MDHDILIGFHITDEQLAIFHCLHCGVHRHEIASVLDGDTPLYAVSSKKVKNRPVNEAAQGGYGLAFPADPSPLSS